MSTWLETLLPATSDPILRGRAAVITVTCLALAAAILFLIIFWKLSCDLQAWTMVASVAGLVVLFIVWFAAFRGYVDIALWCLVALLFIVLTLDIFVYRIEPLTGAGLVIPIAIAGSGQGLGLAFGVAAIGSLMLWIFALGERKGWFRNKAERRRSFLTYNAPALTVINFLIAFISGISSEYWQHLLR